MFKKMNFKKIFTIFSLSLLLVFSNQLYADETGEKDFTHAEQYELGNLFYKEKEYGKAFYWLLKAAKSGNSKAQINLAEMYAYGLKVEQDYQRAIYWLQKAVENGDKDATLMLAEEYYYGNNIQKNKGKAIDLFEIIKDDLKKLNLATAYLYLGELNYFKYKDYVRAKSYFEKAAEQGNSEAQFLLGKMLFNEAKGDKKGEHQASILWVKASNQGHPDASFALFKKLLFSSPTEPSYEIVAVPHLKDAARYGHLEAKEILDKIDEKDDDFQQIIYQSLKYFVENKYKKDGSIEYLLARRYDFGIGVERNLKRAQELYMSAAQNNSKEAQLILAESYFWGEKGINKDTNKAKYWYKKAVQNNSKEASKLLKLYSHDASDENYYQLGEVFYALGMEKNGPDSTPYSGFGSITGIDDTTEANYWFVKANNMLNKVTDNTQIKVQAQLILGKLYYFGLGVEEDKQQAEKLWLAVAEVDEGLVQYELGHLYWLDKENDEKAAYYFEKIAEKGNTYAYLLLGRVYEGMGDIKKAKDWYKKSCDLGNHPKGCMGYEYILENSE